MEEEEEGYGSTGNPVASANSVSSANSGASASATSSSRRIRLADAVAECEREWFLEYLRGAREGNKKMQVIVGQMYTSGYGVPKDPTEGRLWNITALNGQSDALRVNLKHPGYNASDSDSDDEEEDEARAKAREQMILLLLRR